MRIEQKIVPPRPGLEQKFKKYPVGEMEMTIHGKGNKERHHTEHSRAKRTLGTDSPEKKKQYHKRKNRKEKALLYQYHHDYKPVGGVYHAVYFLKQLILVYNDQGIITDIRYNTIGEG